MFVNCLQIDSWLDSSSKIIFQIFSVNHNQSADRLWAVHSEQSQFAAHAVWVHCRNVKVTLLFPPWKTLCNQPTAGWISSSTYERKTWKFTPLLSVVVKFRISPPWRVKQCYRKVNIEAARAPVANLRAWKHGQSSWRVTSFSLTAGPW